MQQHQAATLQISSFVASDFLPQAAAVNMPIQEMGVVTR
jgi:hypothetical protein